jgi:hypothetical protein
LASFDRNNHDRLAWSQGNARFDDRPRARPDAQGARRVIDGRRYSGSDVFLSSARTDVFGPAPIRGMGMIAGLRLGLLTDRGT